MKRISGILPLLVILGIVIVFFARLFFPEPKLFYTSETLGADLWANYYPAKDFLARSLKAGELPFWTKDIGAGFPLFAEGQIGALYLPNLFLYYFFPTWIAWNLNYVIAFFLAFLGSYLFFKRIGISKWSSLFSAVSFSFGGYLISRVIHTSPLQSISLMPWLFLTGDYFWEKQSIRNGFLFALVLSQQILAGGVNWVFISLLGFVIYSVFQFREREGGEIFKKIGLLGIAILFSLLLSAPQIFPTWQLRQESSRSEGLTQEDIFIFPYSLKNFITFVLPDYYGTPKDASFSFEPDLGLYWENTAYLGVLPILFLLLSMTRRRKKRWEWSFMILGVFSLLLVLGRSSPLYFLLTLPGFNNFRVPSRFLVLATFSIAAIAGAGLDWLTQKVSQMKTIKKAAALIPFIAFLAAILDIFRFSYPYHSLAPVKEALAPPQTAQGIEEGERVYTHPEHISVWRDIYFKGGWQDTDSYVYLRNGLYADINLVFDIANIRSYYGLASERQELFYAQIPELLDAASVKFVISPKEIGDAEGYQLVNTAESSREDLPNYYVYLNQDVLDRFRLVSSFTEVENIKEASSLIAQGDYPFENSVILESNPGELEALTRSEISVLNDEEQKLTLETDTDKKALLVVADSYYPAWQATINGEKAEILPANINQRVLIVPEGKNTIELSYYPDEFNKGLKVSAVSLAAFAVFAIVRPGRFLQRKDRSRKE